jgi:hypothetical protein
MKVKLTLAAALALAAVVPQVASASFILDTGSNPGGGASPVLNASNWYAAEFTLAAGETIGDVAAYITQGAGQVGNTFTWDLYSTSGTFIGGSNLTREAATATATGTFSGAGWNTTNVESGTVNWSSVGPGTYWIALQVSGSSQTPGLDLPTESTTTGGTAPATAFAYAGTNHEFETETSASYAVGLEITAQPSTVPLPGPAWLLGGGLLALGAMLRRRGAGAGALPA